MKNVLFIIVDQLRADCLGYAGHPCVQTPNIDGLARAGLVCTNAFTPTPVCMAARAAILTGRYPGAVRVRSMGVLPPGEVTTAEVFQRAGYRTGCLGKLHVTPQLYTQAHLKMDSPQLNWRIYAREACLAGVVDDPFKANYGFQEHVGADDTLRGTHLRWVKEHFPELEDAKAEYPFAEVSKEVFVSREHSGAHHSMFVAKETAGFIRRNAGKGWFAHCGFIHPHHPFDAPREQIARYDGVEMPEPRTGVLTNEEGLIPMPAAGALGEINKYPEAYRKQLVKHYLASISMIDDGVGVILKALEETGQRENTVIVFTGDHGEFLFEHGLLRKPSLHFDDTLRVPFVLNAPGAPRGVVNDGLMDLTDIHPTLLGLAGLKVNPGVQGMDFSAQIMVGQEFGKKDLRMEMCDLTPQVHGKASGPYMAVLTLRTREWKLNVYPSAGAQYGQLFDLMNDPLEEVNLYGRAEHQGKQNEMVWRLLQKGVEEQDPLPLLLTQW